MDLGSFDPEKFKDGLAALEGINFTALLDAIETKNFHEGIKGAEQIAALIGVFVPQAGEVKLALEVLDFIVTGYETGLIKSAEPTDPSMEHAAGKQPGTPGLHSGPVIAPGGTPEDPLDFDHKGPPK